MVVTGAELRVAIGKDGVVSWGETVREVGEDVGGAVYSGFVANGVFILVLTVFRLFCRIIHQGLRSLFIFLFNTVRAENALKCHFRKEI